MVKTRKQLLSFLKAIVNRAISFFELKVIRINPESDFDNAIVLSLSHFKVQTILDVGANEGQFALGLIRQKYRGVIISFEPLTNAHAILLDKSKKFRNWIVAEPVAIGSENIDSVLNVASNSVSSSVLDMTSAHIEASSDSVFCDKQPISIRRLDSFDFDALHSERIYLKIDTQGFELNVLNGLGDLIESIVCIQLEVSFVELYHGQVLSDDIFQWMKSNGFHFWCVNRGFSSPTTGRTLQADYLFVNSKYV